MVQTMSAVPRSWLASFAVTVTWYTPLVVGVPVILPSVPMVRPGGRLAEYQTYGLTPPLAAICRSTAMPTSVASTPGLTTSGGWAALFVLNCGSTVRVLISVLVM
jgi:hypothetical protein